MLLQGQNAQGKTNLLEALFMLATSKPVHAQQEREIVDWLANEEPIPFCRLAAQITVGDRPTEVEIVLAPRGDGAAFVKQVKINGVPRRSMDLIGLLRAVLFLPADIELVSGAPSERRRYLDIALCQIDRVYCRALSSFQQVLTQRNSLLKQLRDQGADPRARRWRPSWRFGTSAWRRTAPWSWLAVRTSWSSSRAWRAPITKS